MKSQQLNQLLGCASSNSLNWEGGGGDLCFGEIPPPPPGSPRKVCEGGTRGRGAQGGYVGAGREVRSGEEVKLADPSIWHTWEDRLATWG